MGGMGGMGMRKPDNVNRIYVGSLHYELKEVRKFALFPPLT